MFLTMSFKERLKEQRCHAGLTQVELANKAGVTPRTIQNYELGTRSPKNIEVVQNLALALSCPVEQLLDSSSLYVIGAQQRGGAKAARDIEELVQEVTGLFAGGQLDDEALEGAMRALNDAYWLAKEKNKKYAPKRPRRRNKDTDN